MDFKVAGTTEGITAFQMDIKIKGISFDILEKALAQAKAGRLHILDTMATCLPSPRSDISQYAPRLETIKIPVDMKDSGAEINVEDDGTVTVAAVEKESADKAMLYIRGLAEVPEIDKVYKATVKKITDFGAFVEILPGKEGLVHVSQLNVQRVEKVEDFVKVGDVLEVKLMHIDGEGKMSLSHKALLPGGENASEEMKRSRERKKSDHRGGRDERHQRRS